MVRSAYTLPFKFHEPIPDSPFNFIILARCAVDMRRIMFVMDSESPAARDLMDIAAASNKLVRLPVEKFGKAAEAEKAVERRRWRHHQTLVVLDNGYCILTKEPFETVLNMTGARIYHKLRARRRPRPTDPQPDKTS